MILHITNRVSPNQLSDEILIARVAQGDKAALETLYDRHAAIVLGLSLQIVGERASTEDILQEIFWQVWQNASAYQSQRGSFTSWLFRLAHNQAIDIYRRGTARPRPVTGTGSDTTLERMPDLAPDVPAQAQSMLETQQARSALLSLPLEQRQVIEMAYFYGMTRQEIAEATGDPLGTVHTRALLAVRKLQDELKKR